MDSQLAFFLVRPAKAMGRKGADPNAVILAGHSKVPADRASDIPICKPDFFFSPKKSGDRESSPWRPWLVAWSWQDQGRDAPGKGSHVPGPSPRCAEGQGGVSALGSLGLTPPGAGFELGLAPHCTPKASFPAGGAYWDGGKASAGLVGARPGLVGPFGAAHGPPSSLEPTPLGSEMAMG